MSSEFVKPTWYSIDFPVLVAAVNLIDENGTGIRIAEIAKSTGLGEDAVFTSVKALVAGDFLIEGPGRAKYAYSPRNAMLITAATEKARRTVGQWPDPQAAAVELMSALITAVENSGDSRAPTVVEYIRDHTPTMASVILGVVAQAMLG